jgi:histone H3/H4
MKKLLCRSGERAGGNALMSINVVIQFFIRQILEVAFAYTDEKGRTVITHQNLFNSIKNDDVLYHFLLRNQIIIPGVFNYNQGKGIHKVLGVGSRGKTLRKIKQVQKNPSCNRIPIALFVKLIRGKLFEYAPNGEEYRCTRGALSTIQLFCESRIVKLFAGANLICIENNRKTVLVKDLILADKLFMGDVRLLENDVVSRVQKKGPNGLIVNATEKSKKVEEQVIKQANSPNKVSTGKGKGRGSTGKGRESTGRGRGTPARSLVQTS